MSSANSESNSLFELLKQSVSALRSEDPGEREALALRIETALGESNFVLLDSVLEDWRKLEDPCELPPEEDRMYQTKLVLNAASGQLYLDMEDIAKPGFGGQIMIEINQGLPCLHLGNTIGCDNVAHLFITEQGIGIVPEDDTARPQNIPSAKFYPGSHGTSMMLVADYEPNPLNADDSADEEYSIGCAP